MIGKIAALLTQFLTSAAARDVAMKYFYKALILAVVPLVIMMGFNLILETIIEYVITELAAVDAGTGASGSWAPLAVYLWFSLGLDVAAGLCFGAASTRLMLRSIPFIRT